MKHWVLALCVWVAGMAGVFAQERVTLPYTNAPTVETDWTTLSGWSGNVSDSYADGTATGAAKFDASGDELILALDGVPTDVRIVLQGFVSSTAGAGRFIVQEGDGNQVWNADPLLVLADSDFSTAPLVFEPDRAPLNGSRYLRFFYETKVGYNLGLCRVEVAGGAETVSMDFVNRKDGFVVAQGAENETIQARVINGGSVRFLNPNPDADNEVPWLSNNSSNWMNGTFNRDTLIIDTAQTGTYYATARAYSDRWDIRVTGTVHFAVAPARTLTLEVVGDGSAEAWVDETPVATDTQPGSVPAGAQVQLGLTPGATSGTESITVNDVLLEDDVFIMPDQDTTVRVTFQEEVAGAATVLISQYYEGAGMDKWVELYNATDAAVDLAADGYRLGIWQNANRESWKTGNSPGNVLVLEGTVAPGETFLVSHSSKVNPTNAAAQMSSATVQFNGDDSVVLYQGAVYSFANVVDALGLTGAQAADISLVRTNTATFGVKTDCDEAQWIRVPLQTVIDAATNANEFLGWHSILPPEPEPEELTVTLSPSAPFCLETGTGGAVTATVAHATGEAMFVWTCEPDCGGTVAAGIYTIPETLAATDIPYVLTCTVTDEVTNTSASISFTVQDPPPAADYVFDFETAWDGSTSYAASTCTHETNAIAVTWAFSNMVRGTDAADVKNGVAAGRFRQQAAECGIMESTTAFPRAIARVAFDISRYGAKSGPGVVVSLAPAEGDVWTPVVSNTPVSDTLVEVVAEVPFALTNATRLKIETFGTAERVNLDDLQVWMAADSGGGETNPPPALTNLTLSADALAFDLPLEATNFVVYGASSLDSESRSWSGSNINAHCTISTDETIRVSVPTTLADFQIIWMSLPVASTSTTRMRIQ